MTNLIEGIQIVNETIKYTSTGWDLFGGIMTGILSLVVFIFIISVFLDSEILLSIFLLIIAIILGLISFLAINTYVTRTSYIEYNVLIEDTVKMNEFNSKYQIVNKDGNIYTITRIEIKQ